LVSLGHGGAVIWDPADGLPANPSHRAGIMRLAAPRHRTPVVRERKGVIHTNRSRCTTAPPQNPGLPHLSAYILQLRTRRTHGVCVCPLGGGQAGVTSCFHPLGTKRLVGLQVQLAVACTGTALCQLATFWAPCVKVLTGPTPPPSLAGDQAASQPSDRREEGCGLGTR
jgi:hypothetical protein